MSGYEPCLGMGGAWARAMPEYEDRYMLFLLSLTIQRLNESLKTVYKVHTNYGRVFRYVINGRGSLCVCVCWCVSVCVFVCTVCE